jgi:hypothetical protein
MQTLLRELQTFRVKNTEAGRESFESWRERPHDDLVFAAALACWAICGVAHEQAFLVLRQWGDHHGPGRAPGVNVTARDQQTVMAQVLPLGQSRCSRPSTVRAGRRRPVTRGSGRRERRNLDINILPPYWRDPRDQPMPPGADPPGGSPSRVDLLTPLRSRSNTDDRHGRGFWPSNNQLQWPWVNTPRPENWSMTSARRRIPRTVCFGSRGRRRGNWC